jgi:hypothetical protein
MKELAPLAEWLDLPDGDLAAVACTLATMTPWSCDAGQAGRTFQSLND